jgi:hypothetical protein
MSEEKMNAMSREVNNEYRNRGVRPRRPTSIRDQAHKLIVSGREIHEQAYGPEHGNEEDASSQLHHTRLQAIHCH